MKKLIAALALIIAISSAPAAPASAAKFRICATMKDGSVYCFGVPVPSDPEDPPKDDPKDPEEDPEDEEQPGDPEADCDPRSICPEVDFRVETI